MLRRMATVVLTSGLVLLYGETITSLPIIPRDQRTPNADHLIDWYKALFAKGVDSGAISYVTCQLDQLLHMNAVWSNNAELNQ